MGNVAPDAITVEHDGAQITITVRTTSAPVDELVPVTADALEPLGLEYAPILAHAQSGVLRTVWIGRRRFTRRSWLLGLAKALPPATAEQPDDDIGNAVRKRARRAAR